MEHSKLNLGLLIIVFAAVMQLPIAAAKDKTSAAVKNVEAACNPNEESGMCKPQAQPKPASVDAPKADPTLPDPADGNKTDEKTGVKKKVNKKSSFRLPVPKKTDSSSK